MENRVPMYGVEYLTMSEDGETSTFEIFDNIDDAKIFIDHLEQMKMTFIFLFKADFDEEYIYQEENGQWNYEDVANLYINSEIIEN